MSTPNVVGPGKFVAYAYTLSNDADSGILFQARPDAPDMMVMGVSQDVVPGLISAMEGLAEGDKFEVTLPPAAAFGDRTEENVIALDRRIFMRDGKLVEEVKEGADLPMMTQEGVMIRGRVAKITDDQVTMDFNHPFAGLTVTYRGEIIEVRDATAEELQPPTQCGCGGCGGGCGGSCGEGDCGGSCGSDCNCG